MNASDSIRDYIKQFEELRLESYLCPSNVWTIGYGHTKGVKPGMKITADEAEDLFGKDIWDTEQIIKKYVHVFLSQNQFDALVSFVFNVGEGNFRTSTLLKKLNGELYWQVPDQLTRWVYGGVRDKNGNKVPLPGLVARRKFEAALWLKP